EKGKIDVRISTLPKQYGEKVVCRILDSTKSIADIDDLGFMWNATALYALEKKKVSAKVTDAERIEIAKKYDADITDCLKGRASKKLVDRDMKIGDDLRLTGTPSYVLDGKKLDMGVFKKEEDFTKFFDRVLAE
nr:hypothetical protein [Candidatus Gracilibacteria bacterium]